MAHVITMKVVPSSSRQGFVMDKTGLLKCYLKAAPERGKANEELIMLLSKALKIPRQHIRILAGETGRKKMVSITTPLTLAVLYAALGVEVQKSLFER